MSSDRSDARRWIVAVLLCASLFWVFDLGFLHAGAPHPLDDTWEYGVMARHLLAGDGFRTSTIHPPLWGLRDAALTVPVLVHGPLLPLLYAPLLVLFGAGALDRVAWVGALFAVLTAVWLVRLGERHARPAVGAAAALLFTLAPLTLAAVRRDITMPIGAFLLLFAFDALARERPRRVAAAVALGLGALTRTEMPLAFFGLSILAGGTGTLVLALGLGLIAGGWWWHEWAATGIPGFNLSSYLIVGYSERWPYITVLQDFAVTPARWSRVLAAQASWLPRKVLAAVPNSLAHVLLTPGALTGWLAVLGLGLGAALPATRRIAAAAFVCGLVPLTVMIGVYHDPRFLVPVLPLWTFAAALGAEWLWRRLPRVGRTEAWIAVLALLMLPSAVPRLVGAAREAPALEARLARERAVLRARATARAGLPRLTARGLERPVRPPGAAPRLILSDTPAFVAWTTGESALWMSREQYDRLPAVATDTLPGRGDLADTWFHLDPH